MFLNILILQLFNSHSARKLRFKILNINYITSQYLYFFLFFNITNATNYITTNITSF